ncbi:diguanylate cyclase [Frankia sp. CNm7]|uniref:Diguanylate cyclase n=1 Tax=Frankia nepalensis TaxID=1836974 RepID=A0A937RKJ1_9ACTN|nr:diguanylate cyclase [Frankia nepalensis]MBL7502046.1 diguanylate cyclase [Frankia nepalensis]MBL7511952.1 diguanylate cyclase [Frankia nepalensis]MBL7524275.1 diguanylate cyclase [Frankia nepalensis]MBL7630544.1 diguanylate cyclase [Frankia nepalensis]
MIDRKASVELARRRRGSSSVALARARERFFEAGAGDPSGVRGLVLRSWARARELAVPADLSDARYVGVEPDCPLVRAARPVLCSSVEPLREAAVVAVLADANGLLRFHIGGDPAFERRMADEGAVALGFDFSESTIGTNGIGTALTLRRPVLVDGAEHYSEIGAAFSCGAAPVRDPVSGEIVGLVNFTCPARESSPLLLAMASSAAVQVERELLVTADRGDLAVLACSDDPAALRALMLAERRRHALREHLYQIMTRAAAMDVGCLLTQIMELAAVVFPVEAVWVLDGQDSGVLRVAAVWGDVVSSAVGAQLSSDVAAAVLRTAIREQDAAAPNRRSSVPLPGQLRMAGSWLAVAAGDGGLPVGSPLGSRWARPLAPAMPPPAADATPPAPGRCVVVAALGPAVASEGQRAAAKGLLAEIADACASACRFEEVSRQAASDALTGLPNRRRFLQAAQAAFLHCRAHGRPMAALMIDIDRFKRVNDTFGHATGDRVLVEVAARIQAALAPDDAVGRIGGEEIAVISLVPSADAWALAERLRRAVAAVELTTPGGTLTVTASVGVACLTRHDEHLPDLLDRADQALYAAKNSGRDRVAEAPVPTV